MTPRYFIGYALPADLQTILKQTFTATFSRPPAITTLHLTLIPTFTLKSESSLDHLLSLLQSARVLESSFTFGTPGLFNQKGKQIFHLPVLPPEPLITQHHYLMESVTPFVVFDTTPFTQGHLPAYEPHVSLDYEFTADPLAYTPPKDAFKLHPLLLFHHTQSGWIPVTNGSPSPAALQQQ